MSRPLKNSPKWILTDADMRFIKDNCENYPDWFLSQFLDKEAVAIARYRNGILRRNIGMIGFSFERTEFADPNREIEDNFKDLLFLLTLPHNRKKALNEQPLYLDKSERPASHQEIKEAA